MPVTDRYRPDPRHADLDTRFHDPVEAAAFPQHVLRFRNDRAAATVGLEALTDDEWVDHFGRFRPLPDNLPGPLALRYHGHQFRTYNPDLGDGRGFLFAQMREHGAADGRLLDLGTKGSGTTPWSRGGDGRLTLKGGVRELLATEMLEALGVGTSRTFSVIETGEKLWRGDEPSPTRSCVLVRLQHSHIRIGSFQRQSYLRDADALAVLMEHVIALHMPDLAAIDDRLDRTAAFVRRVGENCARLAAGWMAAGFVHGVLNTDNIVVTGDSFDYGPWRFLPVHDPAFTAAYFDQTGLYAYGRQPDTLMWNLTRLAETLLPLSNRDRLMEALQSFPAAFAAALNEAVTRRLGVLPAGQQEDEALVVALFEAMGQTQVPFERPFFDWYGGAASEARALERSPHARDYRGEPFARFRDLLRGRAARPGVDLDHPYFSDPAPCTMLIDEVESLWEPIAAADDWRRLHARLAAIRRMGEALGNG
ncbi:protein adenylyltransferase SelO family protein [Caenispirillum bisanense]|uniref:protein adenylyltransferase SelO family protein n=1 Tax=Caenispirillum bisanense TaxID=414052 RepID=UPI0031DBD886